MKNNLSLEEKVRQARSEGATYRELARMFRLSFSQIKQILDGEEIHTIGSEIHELKKRKEKLENEVRFLESRAEIAKKEYYESFNYIPLYDAIKELKRVGGPKNYVLEVWYDWMKRSQITNHDILMFFKRKKLNLIVSEIERLDNETEKLRKEWWNRLGRKSYDRSIAT